MTDHAITLTPNPDALAGDYIVINPIANAILRGAARLTVTETGYTPDRRNRAQRRKDASARR